MNPLIRWVAVLWLLVAPAPLLAARRSPPPYAAIDRHALRAPAQAEQSVEQLAKYLIEPADNDREKARAIYRWITDRIAYDAEAFFADRRGDGSPEAVLKSRKSVCEGYANLFESLCTQAGVRVVKITGWAKDVASESDVKATRNGHAWNAVKVDGHWQLVDATWGSGAVRDKEFVKHFDEYYFLVPPDQLVFSHLPKDPKWQMLLEPVTEKEFKDQPTVQSALFQMGVTTTAVRTAMEDEGLRELVKVFQYPGTPVTLRSVPLDSHLKAGTKYRFRIESDYFVAIAVENEGRWYALRHRGKKFEGQIVAPRGTVKVQGLLAGQSRVQSWGLLEYVGE
jgi:transglutaminase superfamily protein